MGDVGLAANESVTNALEHASPGGRKGAVRVAFRRDGDAYELTVADNGVGTAPGRAARGGEGGSGGQILRALAAQLGGRLDVVSGEVGGTVCRLRFPLPPSGPRQTPPAPTARGATDGRGRDAGRGHVRGGRR